MLFIFDTIIALIGIGVFVWYVKRWYRNNFMTAEQIAKITIKAKSEQLDDVAEVLTEEEKLRRKFEDIKYQFGEKKLNKVASKPNVIPDDEN